MAKKEGLLVVFESIDGGGTSTQLIKLGEHIEKLSKYQDWIKTHEPWRDHEIKRKLQRDRDAYSSGKEMAKLYIEDRAEHTHQLILPNLRAGVIVLTDRYKMSTCSYQWTQGVPLEKLIEMHKNRGILTPDITFFIDIPQKIAQERLKKRIVPREKFERNPEFTRRLISAYHALYDMAQADPGLFGKVVLINGDQSRENVTRDIQKKFDLLYKAWIKGRYQSKCTDNLSGKQFDKH